MDLMNFLSKANGSLENQLLYEVHFKNLFSRKIWLGFIWENILTINTFKKKILGSSNIGNLAHAAKLQERFKIVSKQSSARPGAIIELEAIGDAIQDWQNTMLLHTFQDQVILSQGM